MGTPNTKEYPNGYECKKFGNLVTLSGDITVNDGQLLNVPESVRPSHTKLSANCIAIGNDQSYFIRIYSNGDIGLYDKSGTVGNGRVIFDMTYTLD